MNDRDLSDLRGDRIATTEVRQEGFYWVILGQNPPEIAYWERGEWWLAGDPKPWQPGGGDRRQRPVGVQAATGAGGMMIRGDWRDFRDDPPTSGPVLPGGGCAGGRLDGRSDDTAGGSDDAVSLTC